jgi:hypothetical protein
MRATLLLLVLGTSLSGCLLQNMGAERQLTDQVYALNDEIRWARIDLATERVSPDFRTEFLTLHRAWGHDIQIADSDCTHVQISDDSESATSLVTLSWYDQQTMEVHTSVIEQRWIKTDSGFLLDRVTVVGGEPRILATPEDETADEET